jgi:hypothetical protein
MAFEDGSLRVDFTDVEGQKEFTPIPPSRQDVIVSDFDTGEVSQNSKNAGAAKLSIEFTVQGGDFDGRRIWDTFVVIPTTLWKLKAFLTAIGEDTDGELDITPEDYVGKELNVKLAIQPARKNPETGDEYPARNNVKAYYPAGNGDGSMLP